MSKVVLFNPRPNPDTKPKDIPTSLLFAGRLLVAKGYKVVIISETTTDNYLEEIINQCKDALCFGVTVMTGYQIIDGLNVSAVVKERFDRLPIIWGGWHPTLEPEQTIKNRNIDIVVKGQGEETLYELVHCLDNQLNIKDIKGIVFKYGENIVNNPDREFQHIKNYPEIPFHIIDVTKFLYTTEFAQKTINYVSSYGCPFKCGFCCQQSVTKRKWFGLPAEQIFKDIELLHNKYGVDGITFNDANFFVDESRVRKFCELLINSKLSIKWGNVNGRSSQLSKFDDSTWTLLKRSGLYSILTGAESGSQESLEFMGKDINVEDNIEMAKKCAKHEIKVVWSHLVGFPWADKTHAEIQKITDNEIKLTIRQIRQLLSLDMRHRGLMFVYLPYPGTPLYELSLKQGFKAPGKLEEWGGFKLYALHTPWVLPRQERLVRMLSSYVFFFIDDDLSKWIFNLSSNKMLVPAIKLFYCIFRFFAKLRWRFNYYSFPVDYYLYQFIRNHQKII